MMLWIKCPHTHHRKCQLAKKNNFRYHLSWIVVDLLGVHFLPMGKSNPAFFEDWGYTGKMIRQIWAESAVCPNSYLWRGWIFYLSMGKKWIPSCRSTTTPDRWYQKFLIFGRLALPIMCAQIILRIKQCIDFNFWR